MKTKVINGITYTHRTRDGKLARVLCTDRWHPEYPVLALVLIEGKEDVQSYTSGLKFYSEDQEGENDLFEGVEPETDWSAVKIDTPVWCEQHGKWKKRHFAGLNSKGQPSTWNDGHTSHSTELGHTWSWNEMRLTDPKHDKNTAAFRRAV